mmetsp:Transcript_8094/g.18365  ORF Transcript_8094/g.18365 Transcript_8094/m.18365 type:complete len:221 (+) Transcript_8094:539-1201(+)
MTPYQPRPPCRRSTSGGHSDAFGTGGGCPSDCSDSVAGAAAGLTPCLRASLKLSSNFRPYIRFMMKHFLLMYGSMGSGTATLWLSPSSSIDFFTNKMDCASRRKSNSAGTTRMYASITLGMSMPPSMPLALRTCAVFESMVRSRRILRSHPGICTFTATCVPSRSTPKCTCAMDAVAAGTGLKLLKISFMRLPKLCSIVRTMRRTWLGGLLSMVEAKTST